MEVSADILREYGGARARETGMLVVELCGVFWIAAEMVILLFTIEARRHLLRNPVPCTPQWDRFATRRAVLFALLITAVLAVVALRPLVWETLSARLHAGPLDIQSAALHDFLSVRRHLMVWAAFVTAWVVLEAAIVYQGCRAFRLLARQLSDTKAPQPAGKGGRSSVLPLLICLAVAAGAFAPVAFAAQAAGLASKQPADAWSQVLSVSESCLAPYRNAMYLYLRLAGVAWIAVEWIAAVVLWRACMLIGSALRARTEGS